jgi:hypothetical protein
MSPVALFLVGVAVTAALGGLLLSVILLALVLAKFIQPQESARNS